MINYWEGKTILLRVCILCGEHNSENDAINVSHSQKSVPIQPILSSTTSQIIRSVMLHSHLLGYSSPVLCNQ